MKFEKYLKGKLGSLVGVELTEIAIKGEDYNLKISNEFAEVLLFVDFDEVMAECDDDNEYQFRFDIEELKDFEPFAEFNRCQICNGTGVTESDDFDCSSVNVYQRRSKCDCVENPNVERYFAVKI